MRFLILSDMFSLESWLVKDREPEIMPAVYEFFTYLGKSKENSFVCIIFHRNIRKTISFDNGSVIQILPITSSFHYIRKFFSLFAMYGIGKKQLQKKNYDVIYGLSIYSTIASLLGKKFGILSVSRIFGTLVNDLLLKKRYFKLYTRHILQYLELKLPSDLIICTEDGTKFDDALLSINPNKKVNMLYNGINSALRKKLMQIPLISLISKSQVIRLYSIGRLTSWKRHDLSIMTVYHLKEKYKLSLRLTILGHGEDRSKLNKLIKNLKLTNEVELRSPIPHQSISDFLKQQHIGLFLYDVSNMGNAFWESCLSGRFIVTRNNGKIDTIFSEDISAIVATANPLDIAAHIYKHLDVSIEKDVSSVRNTINTTIPSWESRFTEEISIIKSILKD